MTSGVRPSPCPSCPYRRGVPSGVWAAEEYAKLPAYDAPTGDQPMAAFYCHQDDGGLCAGWVGFGDPVELLAVRIGVLSGEVDPAVFDYRTDVPLFGSGTEAAAHGCAEIERPSADASEAVRKIATVRAATGNPVEVSDRARRTRHARRVESGDDDDDV